MVSGQLNELLLDYFKTLTEEVTGMCPAGQLGILSCIIPRGPVLSVAGDDLVSLNFQ